jgi:hypothetical protein
VGDYVVLDGERGPVADDLDEGWGLLTAINLPDGGELGLYEPRLPTAARRTS